MNYDSLWIRRTEEIIQTFWSKTFKIRGLLWKAGITTNGANKLSQTITFTTVSYEQTYSGASRGASICLSSSLESKKKAFTHKPEVCGIYGRVYTQKDKNISDLWTGSGW